MKTMQAGFRAIMLALAAGALPALSAAAQQVPVPNPSFEQGTNAPDGWTLDGAGAWSDAGAAGAHSIVASGKGDKPSYWRSTPLQMHSGQLYVVRFKARSLDASGGTPVTGSDFANRDLGTIGAAWQTYTTPIFTPATLPASDARLRFGQWEVNGAIAYDDVELLAAQPVHARSGDIVLGEGEAIDGNAYTFTAPLDGPSGNYCRPLLRWQGSFNTNRWNLAPGSFVIYRHAVAGRHLSGAKLHIAVNYHIRGELTVDASRDGNHWQTVGRIGKVESRTFDIPAELQPADQLLVRLHCDDGSLQVDEYGLQCTVDGPPLKLTGDTRIIGIRSIDPRFAVTVSSLGQLLPGGNNRFIATVDNTGPAIAAEVTVPGVAAKPGTIASGKSTLAADYRVSGPGDPTLRFGIGGFLAETTVRVPELYDSSFGQTLPGSSDDLGLWWASSGWKISRTRPAPAASSEALLIRAAKNEPEAAQLVLRPANALKNLTLSPSALDGPAGARIDGSHVEILRERYVHITHPTDAVGAVGDWPDPLPPIRGPLELAAGVNHPFWIRITVPKDAPAGDYAGSIALHAQGVSISVPIRLHVYNFGLPDRMACTTTFGFSPGNVFRYQNLKTDADRRAVLEKYLADFAAHHIAPYDPAPLDPIQVTWSANPPMPTLDFTRWDAAMTRAIDHYHFNSFLLHIPGMGGGTFHARVEPDLRGYKENTPEYHAAFTAYCQAMAKHLRQKGWLDEAYVYWFDEPDPKDYAFVMNGFRKLKEAAPELNRMLTEQVEPALVGGPNIWCPISNEYNHPHAEQRRRAGEKFWWYVCTGPKAPYTTLFIDHPSVELRVWLWQTWQRKIDGILVWETNYWTSPTAYPDRDHPQNPYEDPMSWQSGYGLATGARHGWGNGDGRFIYPPEAAADGNPPAPVLEGPVDSIRWEMLRDGVEDYQYLVMLRSLIAAKAKVLTEAQRQDYERLLEVPAEITTTITSFTHTPQPIESRRDAIARAIERLSER